MSSRPTPGVRSEHYQQIARQMTRQRMPPATEPLCLTVISDSMRPLLRVGDVVVVEPQAPQALQVGQVIVVQRGDEWITHRLQAIDVAGWHTHGDNTRTQDAAAGIAEIVGLVVAVKRGTQTIDMRAAHWLNAGPRIVRIQRLQLGLLDQARRLRPSWLGPRPRRLIAAGLSWPFIVLTRFMIRLALRQSKG